MNTASPDLSYLVESVLIALFGLAPNLIDVNPCHGDEDFSATSPRLVVKAEAPSPYTTNQVNASKRLYRMKVTVSLHANRAKIENAQAVEIFNTALNMVENAGQYVAQLKEALAPLTVFFIQDTEDGNRDREESSRIYTRTINVIAQKLL